MNNNRRDFLKLSSLLGLSSLVQCTNAGKDDSKTTGPSANSTTGLAVPATDTLIVDVHCHPLVPSFMRAFAKNSPGGKAEARGAKLPDWSLEQQLETMDKNGIDVCILSLPDAAESMAGKVGHKAARAMNEDLANLVAKYPTRFGAFAALPMDDMDATLSEMAYALDILKFDGVCGVTQHGGKILGEPVYDPWFTEMNRRGATLFVHPARPDYFDPATNRLNVSALEYMFEQTRMITNMVLSGAKQRFDKVNIIATHAGGTMPFLANRISMIVSTQFGYKGSTLGSKDVLDGIASFYYDLTGSTTAPVLDLTRTYIPANRMLMGFDYPLMPPETIAPAIKSFDEYKGFSESEKQQIRHGNALKLFPRLRNLQS